MKKKGGLNGKNNVKLRLNREKGSGNFNVKKMMK